MRQSQDTRHKGPLAALARPIALTRAGMVLERGLRAFWPLLSLCALIFTGLAFGLPDALSGGALSVLAVGMVLALLGALWFGLRRFRWPTRAEAVRRLDATLPGRPIAALGDQMALGQEDAASAALWRAHLRRMAEASKSARAVAPDPDLARHDPYALRLVALTAAAVALIFGAPLAIFDAAPRPGAPGTATAAMGPSWEGWAEPPRYTGKPGLYLNRVEGGQVTVPEGTRFAFRFYGAPGSVPFTESVSSPAAPPLEPEGEASTVERRDFEAVRSGRITIGGPAGRDFEIVVLSDEAPSVELVGLAERRADGKLAQPFHAQDDHAVVSGQAHVSLDLAAVPRRYGLAVEPEPRPDLVFDLPMPISGSRADFTDQLVEDAEQHPWANLPVKLTLSVEDGRGQTGMSEPETLDLPGRRFFDRRAAALIEVRRDLLWSRENAGTSAEILRAITNRPENFFPKPDMPMTLRLAARRLEQPDLTPETRDEIAGMLWDMAELLEDGGVSDALAAMQQAQQRLSEAIRNGASKDEIDKLMRELKEATDNYLRALAEQAEQQDQTDQPAGGGQGQQITGDQIQQMMDEIQRLMEEGRMAEAQELLDQLARLMENLRVQQGQGGEGGGPGQQAMRDLGETLREQQRLSDEAFRELQQGPGQQGEGQQGEGQQGEGQQGEGQQPGQGPGQGQGGGQPGGQSLADRQNALRQELDRQRGLLPRPGGEAGESAQRNLEDAGRAMEGAEQALRNGDNGAALDRQADAIEALREGMRDMRDALAQEQGGQPGQQQPGAEGNQRLGDATGGRGTRDMPRDPLGRATGDGAHAGSENDMLQGDDVNRRARDLLDEIRRRSAERLRPEAELDYLRRLLDQF